MHSPSGVLLTNDQPGQLKPQEHFLQGERMEAKRVGFPPSPTPLLSSPHSQNLSSFLRASSPPT